MTRFGNSTQWLRLAVGLVGSAAAAAVVVTAMAPATGLAQAEKVTVCHISGSANDSYLAPGVPNFTPQAIWTFGQLMEVNENAVDAHLEHGDSATPHPVPFQSLLRGTYWTTAELFNLAAFGNAWINVFALGQFPNADCGIRYPIY